MKYKNAKSSDLNKDLVESITKAVTAKKGILFFGGTGSGKTHALYSMANLKRAKVENFVELLIEMRDFMMKGHFHGAVSRITSEEKVFIDDIGAEKTSEFVQEFLYLIVNKMYVAENNIYATTNLTIEELEEKYGSRTISRLAEMCEFIEMDGEDRRI